MDLLDEGNVLLEHALPLGFDGGALLGKRGIDCGLALEIVVEVETRAVTA